MKKALLVLMGIACVGLIQAQSFDVSANFGVITRKDFKFDPLILSGNICIDVQVARFIMISPECTFYANSKFDSATMILAPGGTVNLTTGPLFLGAGMVREFWLRSSAASIPLELKLRIGIQASKYRLGAYMLTPFNDLFQQTSFGFTLGFAL